MIVYIIFSKACCILYICGWTAAEPATYSIFLGFEHLTPKPRSREAQATQTQLKRKMGLNEDKKTSFIFFFIIVNFVVDTLKLPGKAELSLTCGYCQYSTTKILPFSLFLQYFRMEVDVWGMQRKNRKRRT